MTPSAVTADHVEQVFRREYGRVVSVLIGRFGDIDLAEECAQDAFAVALERWPADGMPPSPVGWIVTTARNRALDRLRREQVGGTRHTDAVVLGLTGQAPPGPEEVVGQDDLVIGDDRLRLLFTCCHPALSPEARVALTLRLLGGLSTEEVARAFLVQPSTMGQRLSRAKARIRDAGIPYRVPGPEELPERLDGVLAVVYLVYTEGHTAAVGPAVDRPDLCAEAVRLARALLELLPREPEVWGLLALLLLTEARRPARTSADGRLVTLGEQDRDRWDRALVAEGQSLVRRCLAEGRPGPYQVQAAIAAVHSDAPSVEETDWVQVLQLYDQLLAMAPTPVVRLNRAVALAEVAGPEEALAEVDAVAADLPRYHLLHAVRGDLLARLGRPAQAEAAFRRAADLTANPREQAHLRRRAEEVSPSSGARRPPSRRAARSPEGPPATAW